MQDALIKVLGESLDDLCKTDSRRAWTKIVKRAIVDLGHEKNQKVYANGFSDDEVKGIGYGFVNTEMLYDVHWYTEQNNVFYTPEKLTLVVESEWEKNRKNPKNNKIKYSSVKYDFQKLLVAIADLRLMIFKISNEIDLHELQEDFQKSINTFKGLKPSDRFLIVAFHFRSKTLFYCDLSKSKGLRGTKLKKGRTK